MSQFDFFIIPKLTIIFASLTIFAAFFLLFSIVVPFWLSTTVRLLFKCDLIADTKRFADFVTTRHYSAFAAVALSYDLLEQFLLKAGMLIGLVVFLAAFFFTCSALVLLIQISGESSTGFCVSGYF